MYYSYFIYRLSNMLVIIIFNLKFLLFHMDMKIITI